MSLVSNVGITHIKEITGGMAKGGRKVLDSSELSNFEAYLIEEELSKNTRASYLFSVNQFFEKYNEVNKANLVKWKAELLNTLSGKTVNLRLCGMKKYCEYKDLPFSIKRIIIQKTTSVENVMTIKQFNTLIEGLVADNKTNWSIYYSILAKTGARISEFLKFKKSDLDKGYAELHSKGKIRKILFPQSLITEISDFYSEFKSDDYLCTNKYGNQMTTRGFAIMLQKHAKQYGIPLENAHPHSFRHLFAIEFLKRNSNISLLADLLGHSGVNTTMIYLRLSQEQQAEALNNAVDW